MDAFNNDLSIYRLLIVEDSMEYKHLISQTLGRSAQHKYVSTVADCKEALLEVTFDCILLDLSLPDGSGFDLLRHLHDQQIHTPVVILSASKELANKVMGLSMGAQDYLEKPFESMELIARLKNKIVFSKRNEDRNKSVELGNLTIDFSKRKVALLHEDHWNELDLTRKEFELLLAFANQPEIVLSREQLLDRVWGSENFVLERSVDSTLTALRKKLKLWNFKIRAVYGVGYQLVKKVSKVKKPVDLASDPVLLQIFRDESEKQITALEEAIAQSAWDEAGKLVHKLKGTYSIYSTSCVALADGIEKKWSAKEDFQTDLDTFLKMIQAERESILSSRERLAS